MFDADGTFNDNHINNWQHAAMYFGYMVAGFVDVAAHYTELPADSSQVIAAEHFCSCSKSVCKAGDDSHCEIALLSGHAAEA